MSVWLDVGANNGAFSAQLLRRYHFDTSILVEPNMRFEREIDLLRHRYGVQHVRAAAWVNNTHLPFHFNRNDEASSLLHHSPSGTWDELECEPAETFRRRTTTSRVVRRTMRASICDVPRTERVPAIDLSELVFRHARRGRPVIMKLDIEGAEEVVLPHLIRSGAADLLTVCGVEFHANVNDSVRQRLSSTLADRRVLVWPDHYILRLSRFLMRGTIPQALWNARAAARLARSEDDVVAQDAPAASKLALISKIMTHPQRNANKKNKHTVY